LIALYKRRGLYQEVLTLVGPEELTRYCDELSACDPSVWREGLKLAVASLAAIKDEGARKAASKTVVGTMLETILKKKVMTIPSLLPFFSRSTICTFDLFTEYVLDSLKSLDADIRAREEELKRADEELARATNTGPALGADLIYVKAKTCWYCKGRISLPCRYFLCGHSYHMKCLLGEGAACPECKDKHSECAARKLKMIEEAQAQPDILRVLAGADDPGAAFQKVLSGGHFWPETELESQKEINDFRARLEGTIGVE
jgi:hypothetical protein